MCLRPGPRGGGVGTRGPRCSSLLPLGHCWERLRPQGRGGTFCHVRLEVSQNLCFILSIFKAVGVWQGMEGAV